MKKIFLVSISFVALLAMLNIINVLFTECANNLYENCSLFFKSTIGYSFVILVTFLATLFVVSRYRNIQKTWLFTIIPFMVVTIIVVDKLTVLPLQSNSHKFDSFTIENATPMLFVTYLTCLLYLVYVFKRIHKDKDKVFTGVLHLTFLGLLSSLLIGLYFFYELIPDEIRRLSGFGDYSQLFLYTFYILPPALILGILVKLIRPSRFLSWLKFALFFVPTSIICSIYFYASSQRYSGGWLSLNELIYIMPVYGAILFLSIVTLLVLVWRKAKKLNAKSK